MGTPFSSPMVENGSNQNGDNRDFHIAFSAVFPIKEKHPFQETTC